MTSPPPLSQPAVNDRSSQNESTPSSSSQPTPPEQHNGATAPSLPSLPLAPPIVSPDLSAVADRLDTLISALRISAPHTLPHPNPLLSPVPSAPPAPPTTDPFAPRPDAFGTIGVPHALSAIADVNPNVRALSISLLPQFRHKSVEELRWEDYQRLPSLLPSCAPSEKYFRVAFRDSSSTSSASHSSPAPPTFQVPAAHDPFVPPFDTVFPQLPTSHPTEHYPSASHPHPSPPTHPQPSSFNPFNPSLFLPPPPPAHPHPPFIPPHQPFHHFMPSFVPNNPPRNDPPNPATQTVVQHHSYTTPANQFHSVVVSNVWISNIYFHSPPPH